MVEVSTYFSYETGSTRSSRHSSACLDLLRWSNIGNWVSNSVIAAPGVVERNLMRAAPDLVIRIDRDIQSFQPPRPRQLNFTSSRCHAAMPFATTSVNRLLNNFRIARPRHPALSHRGTASILALGQRRSLTAIPSFGRILERSFLGLR